MERSVRAILFNLCQNREADKYELVGSTDYHPFSFIHVNSTKQPSERSFAVDRFVVLTAIADGRVVF